jgi:hypothetical protein
MLAPENNHLPLLLLNGCWMLFNVGMGFGLMQTSEELNMAARRRNKKMKMGDKECGSRAPRGDTCAGSPDGVRLPHSATLQHQKLTAIF